MAKLNLISLSTFTATSVEADASAEGRDLMAEAMLNFAPKRGGKEVKKPAQRTSVEDALRGVLAEAERVDAEKRAAEKAAAEKIAAQRAAEDKARSERAVAAIAARQQREAAAEEAIAILEKDAANRRERDEAMARIRAIGAEMTTLRGVAKTLRLQGNRTGHEVAERKIEALRAEELRLRARLDGFTASTAVKQAPAQVAPAPVVVKPAPVVLAANAFTAPETLVAIGGVEGKTLGSGKYCRPGAKKANKKCKKGK